jgi:7-cyano-7-deazaguanine reductase
MKDESMKQENPPLKSLGESSTVYRYDQVDPGLLEAFPNPFITGEGNKNGVSGEIHIDAPEFTCLCPITGQPDFGTILIDYEPDELCVESKSLKLYLMGYRMTGTFHEALVNRVCNDLVDLLAPKWITVAGEFAPRGGIGFHPTATWRKE